MSHKTIVSLFLLFCLYLSQLHGQSTVHIGDVKAFSFSNLHVLTNTTGVSGYACCYEAEDKSTAGRRYGVKTFDTSLTETNAWTYTCSDSEKLYAATCNGSYFITIILNTKKKILYHKLYDFAGKREQTFEDKLDVNSQYYLEKHDPADMNLYGSTKLLYTFDDGNFVTLIPTKHDNVFTYDINIFNKSNGYKRLLYTPETNVKTQQANFIGSTGELLLFYVFRKKELSSNKSESLLLGIETATGQKKFEVSTREGDFPYLPLKVAYLQGKKGFTLLGNYFKENSKVKKSASRGLCLLQMNEQGQIENKAILNWKEHFDIEEPQESDPDGGETAESKPDTAAKTIKLFQVHAFGQSADGGVYIAGEGYKFRERPGVVLANALSLGLGVANILNGGIGGLGVFPSNDFMPTDLVLIHADSSLKIDSVSRIRKKEHYAERFDTDFCLNIPVQNQFSVSYRDYGAAKTKGSVPEKMLVYRNGKATLYQDELLPETKSSQLFPLSESEILLAEYDTKRKLITLSKKILHL